MSTKATNKGLICNWVDGHKLNPPAALWAWGDTLMAYLLPVAKRKRGQKGEVVKVQMLKGTWQGRRTQEYRRRVLEVCAEKGIEVEGD